jgi:hypothetical protein
MRRTEKAARERQARNGVPFSYCTGRWRDMRLPMRLLGCVVTVKMGECSV